MERQYYLLEEHRGTETSLKVVMKCITMLALLNVLIFTEPIRVLLNYSFTTGMTLDAWGRMIAIVWVTVLDSKNTTKLTRIS